MGYVNLSANGGAGSDYIIGNNRDNIFDGGAGNDTIFRHNGNEIIITGLGSDRIYGGSGIDTVVYSDVAYQGSSNIFLRQAANTVSYNNTDTLTDLEFIQFSDVRISADTLEVTPIIDIEVAQLSLAEGSTASLNLELDTAAPVDVVFNYSTADIDAVAGLDYVATSGQLTIAAGTTTDSIELSVLSDTTGDEVTETLAINLYL